MSQPSFFFFKARKNYYKTDALQQNVGAKLQKFLTKYLMKFGTYQHVT